MCHVCVDVVMSSSPSETSYKPHVEQAPIAIFELNQHGEFVNVNEAACDLIGYSGSEMLDMSIDGVALSVDNPEAWLSSSDLKETSTVQTEDVLLHKDGHEIDVTLETVTLENDRFVVYVQENTQHEQRLKEQRDNLEVLNQVLRHDIRNDLQVITAYTDLLLDRCTQDDEQTYLDTIQESAAHAVELTETARELSDVMLAASTARQEVTLQSVLETQVSEVQSSYPNAVVTYETPIPAIRVTADEMLSSVFRNLLKNAVQHNDKEIAEITVSATEDDKTVSVQIADNGPGVPDDQKESIFGKDEKDLDSPGTGMGLYLVETLVSRYGGDVNVEDNEPCGAVFIVQLAKTGD